jgi:hypothetical protein
MEIYKIFKISTKHLILLDLPDVSSTASSREVKIVKIIGWIVNKQNNGSPKQIKVE